MPWAGTGAPRCPAPGTLRCATARRCASSSWTARCRTSWPRARRAAATSGAGSGDTCRGRRATPWSDFRPALCRRRRRRTWPRWRRAMPFAPRLSRRRWRSSPRSSRWSRCPAPWEPSLPSSPPACSSPSGRLRGTSCRRSCGSSRKIASEEAARLEGLSATAAFAALRGRLDESLDCAAWRFASGKPELDLARAEGGGRQLLEAVRAGGAEVSPSARAQAEQAFARLAQRCAEIARERSSALPGG